MGREALASKTELNQIGFRGRKCKVNGSCCWMNSATSSGNWTLIALSNGSRTIALNNRETLAHHRHMPAHPRPGANHRTAAARGDPRGTTSIGSAAQDETHRKRTRAKHSLCKNPIKDIQPKVLSLIIFNKKPDATEPRGGKRKMM